ncbi:MAG: hypothetical protein ACXWT3_09260 [Methylococcaceae bacterium]
MLNKVFLIMIGLVFSSAVFAECAKAPTGRTVCGNGQTTGGYNPNTGNAWKAQTNQNGVTTTETAKGGQAKTRNGMGVAQTPGGKTCVKTRYNQGCN